jgi:hypothetical protein
MMNISSRVARVDEKPIIWQLYALAMKSHIEAIWGWDPVWQALDFDDGNFFLMRHRIDVDAAPSIGCLHCPSMS